MKALVKTRPAYAVAALLVLVCGPAFSQSAVDSAAPLGNRDSGRTETAVGDLFADAFRWAAKSDVAFVASSEMKQKDPPIPAGKVPIEEIVSLACYPDDPLSEVALTGKALKQALEKSVSVYPQPALGFLQVSGLTFTFDPARKPGERVTDVRVGGSTLDEARVYRVAMSTSLANGALGYWRVWSREDIRRRLNDVTTAEAVRGFLKAKPQIDYSKQDRIRAAR